MSRQRSLGGWRDAVVTPDRTLAAALGRSVPCFASLADVPEELAPSPLHLELQRRAARSPIEIATALSKHYGREFDSIQYQGALAMVAMLAMLAMVGRARLGGLTGEPTAGELAAIAQRAPEPKSVAGATIAGHLIFAELGMKDRVIAAAESGRRNPGHNEMSDSVFMVCPLLAAAGRIGADETFFTACVEHLQRMQALCLRPDGLYRQQSLQDYFRRPAILGPDERSGGMASMVATERALWERR